jgi:hypothetical protein
MYTGHYDDPEDNRPGPLASQEATQDRPTCTAADPDGIEGAEAANFLENHANLSTDEGNRTEGPSDPPLTLPMPESNAAPLLLDHIRVNSIGDYYQVDRLVSLANSKVEQLLRSHRKDEFWVASLPTAIEEAVELTRDKQLLRILAEAAAVSSSTLLNMEKFKSLSVMSDFSFHAMQGCAHENQALNTEHQFEEQKELLRRKRRCLQVLRRTSQCRNINCSAEFQCYIDPNECILRCSICQCKHHPVD